MKKGNKFLLILAVISFVITFVESYLFYEGIREFVLVHLLLSIQNGIKAFLFSPDISATDVLMQMKESEQLISYIIGYAYVISTFVAPLCTASALLIMVKLMFHRGIHFRRMKNAPRILVFGYNDYVKTLLKNLPEKHKEVVHIISDKEFSSAEELSILEHDVFLHKVDCRNLSKKELLHWKKKAELKKASNIILFEDSSYENFTLYLFLVNLLQQEENPQAHVKIYCSCEDDGVHTILEDFYDNDIAKATEAKCNIDLELFSVPDLCARELFADTEHPIYQYNLESPLPADTKWDVHLLIIGLGHLGSSVLTQAINQSILHSSSRIIIDIIDSDADLKFSKFANRFSCRLSNATENGIEISAPLADGQLLIRPHKLDALEKNLESLLTEISADLPITYAALCLTDNRTAIPCMLKLKELFQREHRDNVPIAIRMEEEKVLAEYLKNNQKHFKNVFLIPGVEDIVSIEKICNNDLDRKAKEFHDIYSSISFVSRSDFKDTDATSAPVTSTWDAQEAFKKESTRFLCYHEPVKKMLYGQSGFGNNVPRTAENNLYWGIFEKRGNYFLFSDDAHEMVAQINSNPFLKEMAMLEHRRWSYFMLMHGWTHVNGKKNIPTKETPYLTIWDNLCVENPGTCVYDLMSLFKVIIEQENK